MTVGNFNDDARPDFALFDAGRGLQGRSLAGRTFVILGSPDVGANGAFDLATLDGSNGYVIHGIASLDLAGRTLAAVDLNGDGVDDLALGAPNPDPNGLNNAGQSYVVFGGPHVGDEGVVELRDLNGTNGFVINGARENDLAFIVSNAGDVNGDGVDDLAVGHEGGVALIYGSPSVGSGGVIDIATLAWPVGVRLLGRIARVNGGGRDGIGDINADGFADLAVCSRRDSPLGRQEAGRISVIYGSPTLGMNGPIDADNLDGTNGFFIYGVQTFERISARTRWATSTATASTTSASAAT